MPSHIDLGEQDRGLIEVVGGDRDPAIIEAVVGDAMLVESTADLDQVFRREPRSRGKVANADGRKRGCRPVAEGQERSDHGQHQSPADRRMTGRQRSPEATESARCNRAQAVLGDRRSMVRINPPERNVQGFVPAAKPHRPARGELSTIGPVCQSRPTVGTRFALPDRLELQAPPLGAFPCGFEKVKAGFQARRL